MAETMTIFLLTEMERLDVVGSGAEYDLVAEKVFSNSPSAVNGSSKKKAQSQILY